jgi:hypothetical protein
LKILRLSIIKFLITTFSSESKDDFEDLRLELLNDIILELFEKIRDIYCVLESLEIFNQEILETLFQNKYTMQWLPPSEFDYTHIESFDKIIIANKQHGINWQIIKESTNKLNNKLVWFIDQDTVMK